MYFVYLVVFICVRFLVFDVFRILTCIAYIWRMFVRFISGIAIGIYWFPDSIELDWIRAWMREFDFDFRLPPCTLHFFTDQALNGDLNLICLFVCFEIYWRTGNNRSWNWLRNAGRSATWVARCSRAIRRRLLCMITRAMPAPPAMRETLSWRAGFSLPGCSIWPLLWPPLVSIIAYFPTSLCR